MRAIQRLLFGLALLALSLGNATARYDLVGNVTSRGGKPLTWDSYNRLVKVSQRNTGTSDFDSTTVYDGLGRRVQTTWQPMSSGVNSGSAVTLGYFYDPQVEFLELGHDNGGRTWNVYGPDRSGVYGGLGGCGGLEAVVTESNSAINGVTNNYFGDALAAPGSTTPFAAVVGGYGAMPGSSAVNSSLQAQWRGQYIDPTGFFYMGARYYEPNSGRFLSCDPLGHTASMDLYSYCNGDPINGYDPDGRLGSKFANNYEQGYGLEQSAGMAFTGTLQDAAVSTGSPFLSYSAGLLNATSLTAGQMSSPQVTLPQSFQTNYQAYGDSWTALNATINPAFHMEAGAVELYTGMGISPDNMGQTLSFDGRANGLVKMYTGGVGTVGVAMGGVGLTRFAGLTGPTAATPQISVALGADMSSGEGVTVWRNVPAGHGALADAQAGVVRPYGPTSPLSFDIRAMGHDQGGTFGSGLTSWTADLRWAQARQAQLGGVVIETQAPAGSVWFNQAAQGAEAQILVPGEVSGTLVRP